MKQFKKFYIEITNVCNLSCDFCPKTKRKSGFMSLDDFTFILDTIKPYTDYIYLHVKGEPLLHPELNDILKISETKGFKVNITTNGTLIDRASQVLLNSKSVRQINISLHSMDGNEVYNKKDEYMNRILDFASAATKQSNIIISLRFWNLDKDNIINKSTNKNYKYLKDIKEWFQLPYELEDMITPGSGIKISERIYLNQEHSFEWPDLSLEEDDGIGFCYGLRNQIGVLVDGTIIPCCLDGEGVINLGNIFTDNFTEILRSERVRNIYDGFSNRNAVEELCRKCGYRRKFNTE